MKKKLLKNLLLLLLFSVFFVCIFIFSNYTTNNKFAYADDGVTILDDNSHLVSSDYLDFYSIASDNFTYINNGGTYNATSTLSNAFDRNFETYFESKTANSTTFTNYIDVAFNNTVKIDRILYGAVPNVTRGYPIQLKVYNLNGDNSEQIVHLKSTATTQIVCFALGTTIETTKIRLEFTQVPTNHRYTATAREIIFLQPEDATAYNNYLSLFSDYAKTRINTKYNTAEKLSAFEKSFAQNSNCEGTIKHAFDRARKILSGEISFESNREFSTNDNATNKINRYGNIVSQARNVLKMNSFGTNRQVTGIVAKSNENITIYVEGEENDPLPKIRFLQVIGYWNSFISSEYQLTLGKNIITVPYFINSNYSENVPAGASAYIINPYTKDEQSKNVRVYFEDGDFFPVYRLGDDENTFKEKLSTYYTNLSQDSTMFDITEIVTNHAILTLTAKNCYKYYIEQKYSPKITAENWQTYMTKLLKFGGVALDSKEKNYSPINNYLNINIRVSQVWSGAGAYAYTEHIGVYRSFEGTAIMATSFGWGISHEIGHTMDIPDRTIGETTNNMWAKYNETAIEKLAQRDYAEETTEGLSSDRTSTSEFFNSNRYNYNIWWNIECYQKGFWANLENCYRGLFDSQITLVADSKISAKVSALTKTERHVLYASLALGIDLSYYFERWGFNMNTGENVFVYDSSSQNFKDCMSKALSLNLIDNTKQPKFWYQDAKAYLKENVSSTYSSNTTVTIKNVFKVDDGYSILINGLDNTTNLGYEILEGNDENGYTVIGFTHTQSFTDTTIYQDDYTPQYKVVAYDNKLCNSAQSLSKTYTQNTNNVCMIEGTFYTSLYNAILAAENGDTITLLTSTYEQNMIIEKNITITINDNDIVIYRTQSGNLFTINKDCTLTLNGMANNYLTISGYSVSQKGPLIYTLGTVNATYINFIDNISIDYGVIGVFYGGKLTLDFCNVYNNVGNTGGAFSVVMSRGQKSSVCTLKNVKIYNNSATIGAVARTNGTLTIENCNIYDNNATGNGTIYMDNGGVTNITSSTIKNNTAQNGGVIYVADGTAKIISCLLENNTATSNGGAVFMNASGRTFTITSCTFTYNKANSGMTIYLNNGTINLDATISTKQTITNTSKTLLPPDIFVGGGKLAINSKSTITGVFTVSGNADLTLQNGLFNGIETCLFQVTDIEKTATLLTADSFDLTADDLTSIVAPKELFSLSLEGNKVIVTVITAEEPSEPEDPTTPTNPTPPTTTDDDKDTNNEQEKTKLNHIILITSVIGGIMVVCIIVVLIVKKKSKKE